MSVLLSHFFPAYPSPSPCPQVHSLQAESLLWEQHWIVTKCWVPIQCICITKVCKINSSIFVNLENIIERRNELVFWGKGSRVTARAGLLMVLALLAQRWNLHTGCALYAQDTPACSHGEFPQPPLPLSGCPSQSLPGVEVHSCWGSKRNMAFFLWIWVKYGERRVNTIQVLRCGPQFTITLSWPWGWGFKGKFC